GRAERWTGARLDAGAAARAARVDEVPRIPEHVLHLGGGDVHLLGDELAEPRRDAVAAFDLARLEHDLDVAQDADPRVDLRRIGQVARGLGLTRGGRRFAGKTRAEQAEADDERTAALEERLTAELLL